MINSGIYQIVNTVNGHRYIGSAVSLTNRWRKHSLSLRRGSHHSAHLQSAWNKYGESAFDFRVIGTCQPTDLIRMEQHLLDDLRPEYNVSPTAGSILGLVLSPEACAKIGATHRGKTVSPETRARMSASKKGRKQGPRSPETRAKISMANRRRIVTPETKARISEALKGRKLSPETKQKISDAKKGNKYALGYRHSPEHRANLKAKWANPEFKRKMSEAMRARGK